MTRNTLSIIIFCVLSTSFSCSSDDDNQNKVCKPIGFYSETDGDSLTFGRDAAGLLRTVDWYDNEFRYEFTYDNNKQMTSVLAKTVSAIFSGTS